MLGAVAAEAGRRFGDRTAFVAPDGRPLSYADLDQHSDEVAAGMLRRGIGEGDVVALILSPGIDYPIAYLAAAKIGAVTAGVNTRLAVPERERLVEIVDPALVIDDPSIVSELRLGGESPHPLPTNPERPVAIVFTSGTTGTPKGAVFAWRQLQFVAQVDTGGRWGSGGDQIAGTSFAHLAFMTKLPGKLMSGGVTWMVERWQAAQALRLTAEHRMTRIGGIPTQVALMLRQPDFDAHDLSSVDLVIIGGGPATPALVREARTRFGAPVLVRYSCTEAGIGTGTGPDDPYEDAEISVGRPQPGVDLCIDAPNDDGVGEICLRSPAVMSGYFGDEAAAVAAFTTDGFVRTGDLGWVDEVGRLRLAGRSKEMYVRGGYNVFPHVVESVLSQHPAVADLAVVPRPDEVMGEVGVAVVVARAGTPPLTLAALREFGVQHLAHHELPERLLVVESLPLTAMDKVDRTTLGALVQTADPPSDP